jgi:hypothetical protein
MTRKFQFLFSPYCDYNAGSLPLKERNLIFPLGQEACPSSCSHVYPLTIINLFDKYIFVVVLKYYTCYHFDAKPHMLPSNVLPAELKGEIV